MKFKFGKIENIVILGYSPLISDFININKDLGIKSFLITSADQKKKINQDIDFKVFDKLDKNFKNFISKKFTIKKTLFISLSARWIFKKDIINFLKKHLINFHSSRLPFFKGGATFSWQILAEDRIHNQCIHFITENVDAGEIIENNTSIFPNWCKIPRDYENYDLDRLKIFYKSFIKKINNQTTFEITKQAKNYGSYYPRIFAPKDGWIDWNEKGRNIYNFINSMDDPYDGAKTSLNSHIVKIKKVEIHKGNSISNSFASGLIIKKNNFWIEINCSDGYSLLVQEVLDKNNKNFFNKVKIGDRLVTPMSKLYDAKLKRSKFNVNGFKCL